MPDKAPSSKAESSSPKDSRFNRLNPLDKLYYWRIGLSIIAGLLSGPFYNGQESTQLLGFVFFLFFYMLSVVISRFRGWAPGRKAYTHGVITALIFWFVAFSLYVTFIYH